MELNLNETNLKYKKHCCQNVQIKKETSVAKLETFVIRLFNESNNDKRWYIWVLRQCCHNT